MTEKQLKREKILKTIVIVALSAAVLFVVAVITIFASAFGPPKENLADGPYYQQIHSLAQKEKEIDLAAVFGFEWDRVYMAKAANEDGKAAAEELGITNRLTDYDGLYPCMRRLVFINGDEAVCDFLYDSRYLRFSPLGGFIPREEAVFAVKRTWKIIKMNYSD